MRYAGCIFDLDGVLLPSEPWHRRLAASVLAEDGVHLEPEELTRYMGVGHRKMFDALIAQYGLGRTAGEYLERFGTKLQTASHELKPIPGVEEVLAKLLQGDVALAVATATPHQWAEVMLESSGLRKYFRVVVGGDDVAQPKPAPDTYLRATRLLGVPAQACLAVEDSAVGVQSALAAGLQVIWFCPEPESSEALPEVASVRRITAMDQFPLDWLPAA